MSVVEKLKLLSEHLADGTISQAEFERLRADLLDAVEPAEEAPPPAPRRARRQSVRPKPEAAPVDAGVTLALVGLASVLPGLIAMLLFDLPLWSGATIFVAVLGGLTWLWARTLREPGETEDG